jgi:tripartite ATP-independent transporter DctP family solute receptor
MRQRLRAMVAVGSVLFTLGASACGAERKSDASGAAAGGPEKVTLRLAHTAPPGNAQTIATERFAELVSENTDGGVTVELYPNAQLGAEEEILQKLQEGSVDMAVLSTTITGNVVPIVGVFDLPYLFRDYAHVASTVTGPVAEEVNAAVLEKGMHVLGYQYIGFRITVCKKQAIDAPGYFAGVSIRVPGSPVSLDTFKAFEAEADPIPYDEVFTALQTGVVDCVDSVGQSILNSKFYEVAKTLSLTNHQFGLLAMMINEDRYGDLPDEYRTAIQEAADEANQFARDTNEEIESQAIEDLESEGVKVVEIDTTALEKQAEPVREAFGEQVGGAELVARIHGTQ